jgi:hypothetical protein
MQILDDRKLGAARRLGIALVCAFTVLSMLISDIVLAAQAVPVAISTEKLSVRAEHISVYDFVSLLRTNYLLPISFIDAAVDDLNSADISVDVTDGTLQSVLETVRSQAPAYTYASVRGKVVLYPDLKKYTTKMYGISITDMPRLNATQVLLAQVAAVLPEFRNWLGPVEKGNPSASLFSERVTLASSGTILEQFAGLLGDDRNAVYSVVRGRSGSPIFTLDHVVENGQAKSHER